MAMSVQGFGMGQGQGESFVKLAQGAGGGSFLFVGEGIEHFVETLGRAFICDLWPRRTPCGQCEVCKAQEAIRSASFFVSDEFPLSIDTVRAARETLRLKPVLGERRAVFFRHFETASKDAQNALLKVIEEPPPHTLLLLTSRVLEGVLPTLRSRLHILELHGNGQARSVSLDNGLTFEALVGLELPQRFNKVQEFLKSLQGNDDELLIRREVELLISQWLTELRVRLIRLYADPATKRAEAVKTLALIERLRDIFVQVRRDSATSEKLLLESFVALLP